MLKTLGEDRYKYNYPIRHLTRDIIIKNTIPYTNQINNYEIIVYLRYLAQLCTFRTENFTTYLKRTPKCTPNHPSLAFGFRTLCSFFFFTDLRIDHVFWQKIKIKQSKRDVISKFGWYVRKTVSKNHVQTCTNEWGIANQPLRQRLDWPSSYAKEVQSGSHA